jgi:endonuclease/exonuclease/phosphatase family metal-dependent hydrolase
MTSFDRSTVQIAAWNLAGFQQISEERLKAQILGLSYLDADLVMLVEINPISHLDNLVEGLRTKGVRCKGAILPQVAGNPALNIGILYKEGIEVSNLALLEGSEGSYPNGRRALTADVKVGKLDIHLIGVHLKSERTPDAQRIRDSQCRVIGNYITALRADAANDGRMIMLLGDYNMIPGQDVSNFHLLGGDDLMDFVSSWDLQEKFSHILEKGPTNLLDGYAISTKGSSRYIPGTLRLFPMHWTMKLGQDAFRRRVSDHLPFIAGFRIN